MSLAITHTPLIGGDATMNNITCKGKPQPSQEALDKFVNVYLKMVKQNEAKRKGEIDDDKR